MPKPNLTIAEIQAGLREKKYSAEELTRSFLTEIKERDPEIGAFLSVREEQALEEACAVDEALAARAELSPLAGIPLAVKDNLLLEGEITTAGSKILKDYRSSYSATVIRKLQGGHAVILGKTNLDEFAMGTTTENSGFQVTRNPRDPERVPGGSSGGSAAAVAAGLAAAGLGSDTGGSIRQPAAFCGIVGLKPTYGAVSRFGLIAMASSLDQIGPLTKTTEDAAILFDQIRGADPLDATSTDTIYGPELLAPEWPGLRELKIGIPKEYFLPELNSEIAGALELVKERFAGLGLKIKPVSLPHTRYALSAYYIIVPAEVSANLARFDGIRYCRPTELDESVLKKIYFKTRGLGLGTEVKRRIILGTFVLSSGYYDAYYGKAQQVRTLIRRDFQDAFSEVDVILSPVSPNPPFKIGEKIDDPLSLYLEDVFTLPVNLAGLPGLSLPTWTKSKLPIGFQLIGKHFREADILGLGRLYEKEFGT